MTDQRPSENTDGYPKFPTMVGMFGSRPTETPTPTRADALDSLNIAYSNQNDPHEVACGNAAAITQAVLVLAEQQRIANLIAFQAATGESYRAEIRKGLGL